MRADSAAVRTMFGDVVVVDVVGVGCGCSCGCRVAAIAQISLQQALRRNALDSVWSEQQGSGLPAPRAIAHDDGCQPHASSG